MDSGQPSPPALGRMLVSRGLLREDELVRALGIQEVTGAPLGEILKDLDLVSPSQLADLLVVQRAWRPLGQMLLDEGLLSAEQLAECLDEQERSGRRLGDVVGGRGIVPGGDLKRVLDEQYRLELELERGFGAGLRDEIERRHRLRRGQEEAAGETPSEGGNGAAAVTPLTTRLDVKLKRQERTRIAALQERLDEREETIESLGIALHHRTEELERLRTELGERDAIIQALRRRAGEDADEEPGTAAIYRLPATDERAI